MNAINEINKNNYHVPKYLTCKDCEHTLTCPRFDECDLLLEPGHVDDAAHLDHVAQIKATISPLPYTKFKLGRKSSNVSSDDQEPIYAYHRKQVNDALSIIRRGGNAYAYTDQVLKDILKFENNVDVALQNHIYYIRINNA